MKRFSICIILLILFASPLLAVGGGIYVYVDEEGVSHYTNVPTSNRYKPMAMMQLNTPRPSSATAKKNNNRYRVDNGLNPTPYDHHIQRAALSQQVDPMLIKAIIKAESNFNRYAVSRSGAQGLMQLMPATAQDMMVANPFDPGDNIAGGTRYFSNLLNAYEGNLSLSLAAYNAGPSRVAKKGPLPRIRETREYVRRVIENYHSYQKRAANSISMSQNINVRKLVTVN